ncbi:EpsG family protein [Ligilactobacillus aviarius]|uniref:EpsG family protein n=1 Tax=Ligilactobacillus aviarius TaxID=1606 RepID=UPI00195CB8EB|nr:EpsG family protein [Ligilactobacillus aviarius]
MLYICSELFMFLYQLIKKNTKFIGLIGMLILGYLAGTANPVMTTDYAMYNQQYIISGITGNFYFEHGYSLLGAFFYHLGFNYTQFRTIFAFIIVVIMYIAVCRYTNNVALFVLIYGLVCFFNDATQIRNFMMISLVLLGISFLKEKKLRNIIIATLLILLSAQFQSSGYYFLLVVLVRLIPKNKLINGFKSIIFGELMLTAIVLILGKTRLIKILSLVATPFSGGRENLLLKIENQYVYGISKGKTILIGLLVILVIVISNKLIKPLKENDLAYILYCGIIVGMFAYPLVFVAIDYSRIIRNAFIFFILLSCLFINRKEMLNINTKNYYSSILNIFLVCLLCMFINYYVWGPWYQQSIPYIAKLL